MQKCQYDSCVPKLYLNTFALTFLLSISAHSACTNTIKFTPGIDFQMLNSSAINSNHSSLEAGLETGKGWCVSNNSRPYLTIDFGKLVTVSKIETQGAFYDGKPYFLSSYHLKFGYSNPRWFDDVERGQVKVIILPLIYTSKGVRFLEFQTVV